MGFRDFIRNRLFRERVADDLDDLASILPPVNPSRRYLDRLVKVLVSGGDIRAPRRELHLNGAAAVPALSAALDHSALPADRLDVVLELLAPHAPDTVVSAAVRHARSDRSAVRKIAGLHLAAVGQADTLPILAELLNDADGYVRSYVSIGARRAMAGGRADPAFLTGIYDLLLAQCDQNWLTATNSAAEAVVALDPVRAAADFGTDRWLTPGNRFASAILEACNRGGVVLPEPRVREMLGFSLPLVFGEQCYPHDYVAGGALEALARTAGEAARPTLDTALAVDNDRVRAAAARGLARLAGLDDPLAFVLDRLETVGLGGLTDPQRAYYRAFVFDAEVTNGGLMQFFGNSGGDHAARTLDALRTIGEPGAVRVLDEAMKRVGPAAGEHHRDARLDGIGGRFDELQAAFAPLEADYSAVAGRLKQRMFQYAAANPTHFGA